jgi:hypothetical protein
MKTSLIAMMLTMFALTSPVAKAQPFIEIEVTGYMMAFIEEGYLPAGFRVIFDTGAAPDVINGDEIEFRSVWGEAIDPFGQTPIDAPSAIDVFSSELEFVNADFVLIYDSAGDNYFINSSVIDGGNGEIQFRVGAPKSVFNLSMTSLPDTPDGYQRRENIPTRGISFVTTRGVANWAEEASQGYISIRVRTVDGPPVETCPGDLNGDGVLNFFDVSTFLSLFNQGCP